MARICVFCGSSSGTDPKYIESAEELGRKLVEQGYGLVYGGASIGTMGAVADAVLSAGGEVVGVIPQSIADMEVAHTGLSKLEVVADMHQRKARMMQLSDGFISMPGGLGTLEELFEVLTWAQLGLHKKPSALLNLDGYYDSLLEFLDNARDQGFAKQAHIDTLAVSPTVEAILPALMAAPKAQVAKV